MKKIFNKSRQLFIFLFTIILLLLCMQIPHILLTKQAKDYLDVVQQVSDNELFASYSALAQESSKELSAKDRIQIILGNSVSDFLLCDDQDGFLSKIEAVTLAKNRIEALLDQDLYPCSISSSYDNWYGWEASLYRCIDQEYHSYSTYLWDITYFRYDEKLTHHFYMTESGTLLAIEVIADSEQTKLAELFPFSKDLGLQILSDCKIEGDISSSAVDRLPQIPYPDFPHFSSDILSGEETTVIRKDSDMTEESYSFITYESQLGFGILFY